MVTDHPSQRWARDTYPPPDEVDLESIQAALRARMRQDVLGLQEGQGSAEGGFRKLKSLAGKLLHQLCGGGGCLGI